MRYIVFNFFLPLCLVPVPLKAFAIDAKSPSSLNHHLSSSFGESFYTNAKRFVQEQIYLTFRMEQALSTPDPNRIRAVRGQVIVQAKAVQDFLERQYPNPDALCNNTHHNSNHVVPLAHQLSTPQVQIYCSLYTSHQELLQFLPGLDRLLARRGELALVRELPLVSGQRQSHPVLSLAPVERPDLSKPATPFFVQEPNLPPNFFQPQKISTAESFPHTPSPSGRTTKTFISGYLPPIQPAIAPDQKGLQIITIVKQALIQAQKAFPQGTQFQDPWQTSLALDQFAYGKDAQELRTYAKFLTLPRTGIFRVLPYSAYHRPLNTLANRLQKGVSERYPFPALSESKEGFTPSLALQIVDDNFQLISRGLDYGFIVDVGDIPLEKLDAHLQAVTPQKRQLFLSYQPPKQLNELQREKRRFFLGKDPFERQHNHPVLMGTAKAVLNHTYIGRSLQFQLPEMILNHRPISPQERRQFNQLLKVNSSDIIFAFRPVRRRRDGSYTIVWRVLRQLEDPKIEDLEAYVKIIPENKFPR